MRIKTFTSKQTLLLLAVLIFIFAFSLRIWNLNKAGQVWDEEPLLSLYAYHHVQHAIHLDFGNDFWWKGMPDHPPLVRYMRGVAAMPDLAYVDKNNRPVYNYDLTYNRLLSVVLTSLGAVIVFLIGVRYLSLFTGITAGIIFAMLPVPLGHSQVAVLEALALFFFPASMFTFFLFLEKQSKKRIALAGIALGFALLARETHAMLLPMMLLMVFTKHYFEKFESLKIIIYKTFGIFLISFFTFFCLWPMPFFHIPYMIEFFQGFRLAVRTSVPEVFFGKLLLVPYWYYLVQFLITTPLLILLFFFNGIISIFKTRKWILYMLIIWFTFPFVMSFYHTRQQGIRYIIQICIPIALIAAYGLEKVITKFSNKSALKILALSFLFLYQFIILWKITPYYLDYYNILVGGAKGVYEKRLFHLGWWGEGMRETALYLDDNAPKGATIGIAIMPPHTLPPMPNKKVSLYQKDKKYDYVIVSFYQIERLGFDDSMIKKNYKVVYSVIADGAHLVEVYKRK